MWKKIEYTDSEDELNSIIKAFKKKARFLLDENIDPNIAEDIGNLGYRVTTVYKKGLAGKPDTTLYNYARKKKYVLVTTNTKDFWNDTRKMPLKTSPGIICLESDPGNTDKLLKLLAITFHWFGAMATVLDGAKVKISKRWIIMKLQGRSKVEHIKYDLTNDDMYQR